MKYREKGKDGEMCIALIHEVGDRNKVHRMNALPLPSVLARALAPTLWCSSDCSTGRADQGRAGQTRAGLGRAGQGGHGRTGQVTALLRTGHRPEEGS